MIFNTFFVVIVPIAVVIIINFTLLKIVKRSNKQVCDLLDFSNTFMDP